MKTFFAFIRKEFIHIIRDWRTTLITLVTPVVLVLIFGYAISTEIHSISLMAVVEKHTEETRQQIEKIAANPYFEFLGYTTEKEMDKHLRSGHTDAVIVYDIHCNRQLVVDAADANISATATIYLQQALATTSDNDASALFTTTLRHNPQLLSAYNYVPGVMGLVFILICAIMTSASIVREKETGTMEVLLVSPVRPVVIILAKMVPYFVIACINLLTIILLVHFAMGIPLQSFFSIVLVSVVYVILSLALGMLVSALVDKQIIALLICAMVMLIPILMFSGMIYPTDNLPTILSPIPYIIPAKWYIDAMKKLMIEGVDFRMVWLEFTILLSTTVLLLSVALWKFNDKLE